MAKLTKEEKLQWLSAKYFAVSNIRDDDFNPYTSLDLFLKSTVGSLRWGTDETVKKDSKNRFADTFSKELSGFQVILSLDEIFNSLQDGTKTNSSVIEEWSEKAKFPD
jgi:hypothetical protein